MGTRTLFFSKHTWVCMVCLVYIHVCRADRHWEIVEFNEFLIFQVDFVISIVFELPRRQNIHQGNIIKRTLIVYFKMLDGIFVLS